MRKNNASSVSLFDYVHHHVKPFFPHICVLVVVAIIDAFVPTCHAYLIKKIIDLVPVTPHDLIMQALLWPVVYYMLLATLLEVIWRIFGVVFQEKMIPQMRANIISSNVGSLLRQSYGFYQKRYPGQLTDNMVKLSDNLPMIVAFFHGLLSMALLALLNIFLLNRVSPYFGLIVGAWVVVFFSLVYWNAQPVAERATNLSEKKAKMYGRLVDTLTNVLSIKLFARKRNEQYEINKTLAENVATERKVARAYWGVFALLAFFYLVFQSLSIFLLVRERSLQRVTAGDFVLVFTMNNTMVTMFWFKVRLFLDFARTVGQSRQALRAIFQPVDVKDAPNAKKIEVSKGDIVFKEVSFRYDDAVHPIFNEFSLHILAGQKVGLVGSSGGGKSTLIKLLLRLYNIDGGAILVDGQNIAKVTQESLRQQVGLVPQQPTLFHRSIGYNIHCARPSATWEEVMAAARAAHAHGFIAEMPEGYATLAGDGGSRLSGGQRQRVAMARAMLANPRILLLDEATSDLDVITEQCLQLSLEAVMKGKTTIVVAHRLSTLLKMDRIIVMDYGKIVEDGTHADLLAKQGRYHELWNTQVDGFLIEGKETPKQ